MNLLRVYIVILCPSTRLAQVHGLFGFFRNRPEGDIFPARTSDNTDGSLLRMSQPDEGGHP